MVYTRSLAWMELFLGIYVSGLDRKGEVGGALDRGIDPCREAMRRRGLGR